ncbi:12838_t:CDS:1, partial [Cetraspora pellucida]
VGLQFDITEQSNITEKLEQQSNINDQYEQFDLVKLAKQSNSFNIFSTFVEDS